jgi:hypothetical protein
VSNIFIILVTDDSSVKFPQRRLSQDLSSSIKDSETDSEEYEDLVSHQFYNEVISKKVSKASLRKKPSIEISQPQSEEPQQTPESESMISRYQR